MILRTFQKVQELKRYPVATAERSKNCSDLCCLEYSQTKPAFRFDRTPSGIETIDQLERLKIMGCKLGQGCHFARPLTPEDAIEMLSSSTQLV
jgi:hypothetical protein